MTTRDTPTIVPFLILGVQFLWKKWVYIGLTPEHIALGSQEAETALSAPLEALSEQWLFDGTGDIKWYAVKTVQVHK